MTDKKILGSFEFFMHGLGISAFLYDHKDGPRGC